MAAFVWYVCKDLAPGTVATMLIGLCWLTSIRFIHLMTMPEEDVSLNHFLFSII